MVPFPSAPAGHAQSVRPHAEPIEPPRPTDFPLDAVFKALALAGLSLDALVAYLALTRDAVFERIIRFGLPIPPDMPLRKPSTSGWTVPDIRLLIEWRTLGVHPEIIGQNLSRPRSANATRSKCRRLGLAPPPRSSLFRPSLEQLDVLLKRGMPAVAIQPPPISVGSDVKQSSVLSPRNLAPKKIPARIEDIDFQDLTWVGSLPGRRGRPGEAARGITTSRVAVYAIGVMACAGVDRFEAAKLLGLTVGAYRSQRTRLGLPRVAVRSAFTDLFDVEVGQETIKRANLELVASMRQSDGQPPQFFWRFRDERHVRFSPTERPQRKRGEPTYSKSMTIVTRAMLDQEARAASDPASPTRPLQFRSPRPPQVVPPRQYFVPPSAVFATGHASV